MDQETKFEYYTRQARKHYCCENEEQVERVACHLFAKHLVGGATIGRVNGKFIIDRPQQPRPRLP